MLTYLIIPYTKGTVDGCWECCSSNNQATPAFTENSWKTNYNSQHAQCPSTVAAVLVVLSSRPISRQRSVRNGREAVTAGLLRKLSELTLDKQQVRFWRLCGVWRWMKKWRGRGWFSLVAVSAFRFLSALTLAEWQPIKSCATYLQMFSFGTVGGRELRGTG